MKLSYDSQSTIYALAHDVMSNVGPRMMMSDVGPEMVNMGTNLSSNY